MSAVAERNQLAEIATKLLGPAIPDGYVIAITRAATCHPNRPTSGRGLCRSCWVTASRNGTLDRHARTHTIRTQAEFVADYALLRSEGYTRRQIADRLKMRYDAVTRAYLGAVRKGLLTPDRGQVVRRAS